MLTEDGDRRAVKGGAMCHIFVLTQAAESLSSVRLTEIFMSNNVVLG